MKRLFILCLPVFFLPITFLHSQDLDSVKGGYTNCHIYEYKYKSGQPDTSSKKEIDYYKYNSRGNKIEKHCIKKLCVGVFEGSYFDNVAIEKYDYDDNGNITEEKYYNGSSGLLAKITRTFNSKGKNTEELTFKSEALLSKISRNYDAAGNMIEETKYTGDDFVRKNWVYDSVSKEIKYTIYGSSDSKTYKYTMKLDERGNTIEFKSEIDYDPVNSQTYYEYDKDGNILEEAYSDGYDYKKDSYQYDTIGRVIEHKYYQQGGYFNATTKTEYDAAGNRTAVTAYDSYYIAKNIAKFNSHNQIAEDISYNNQGVMISKTLYSYDVHSNLIETIDFEESETPVSKIEYVYSK